MQPEGWQHVKRVLVMRLDNIGDVIMLGPALRTLRQALPNARITLMASPAGTQVAGLLPWLDEVITYRPVWQDASGTMPFDPVRETTLVAQLRAGQYDAAAIFTSFSQSPYPPAYACYMAGIPVRLGQSKEFGGSVLSQWVRSLPDSAHQVDRNLFLLTQAGFQSTGSDLELQIPVTIQQQADQILAQYGLAQTEPFVVMAPGASCPARRYDPTRFAEVARQLWERTRLRMVLVGSQKEHELVEPILATQMPGLLDLVGKTSVAELVAIIARSALLIANDSGPMHMADALNRPMVILYSGTELESQWQPRRAPAVLLRRPTNCSPCHRFQCPYHMECLDIPAAEVVEQSLNLLSLPVLNG